MKANLAWLRSYDSFIVDNKLIELHRMIALLNTQTDALGAVWVHYGTFVNIDQIPPPLE